MIGGMWRWLWTASVFGVFALVIAAALDGAPRQGEMPVIAAGNEPIKDSVELPPPGASVPSSTVLNLLVEGDAPNEAAGRARDGLDAGRAAETAREERVEELRAALAEAPSDATPVDFRIQLAAVRPGEEHDAFDDLRARYEAILADLSPRFQVFSSEQGVLVRVQAGPLAGEDEAAARCQRVEAAGGECFVVRAPG